jgi:hypothetical protein
VEQRHGGILSASNFVKANEKSRIARYSGPLFRVSPQEAATRQLAGAQPQAAPMLIARA